jgi:hypothetical protein
MKKENSVILININFKTIVPKLADLFGFTTMNNKNLKRKKIKTINKI